MNNLIKIILIILVLNFLFKNNKENFSESPSIAPSVSPSIAPSVSPSIAPSVSPSIAPSVSPSIAQSSNCGANKKLYQDNGEEFCDCIDGFALDGSGNCVECNGPDKIIQNGYCVNNTYDSNVSYKIIKCDEDSPCEVEVDGDEKYATCNVTINNETKKRSCLKDGEIKNFCEESKNSGLGLFNDENHGLCCKYSNERIKFNDESIYILADGSTLFTFNTLENNQYFNNYNRNEIANMIMNSKIVYEFGDNIITGYPRPYTSNNLYQIDSIYMYFKIHTNYTTKGKNGWETGNFKIFPNCNNRRYEM